MSHQNDPYKNYYLKGYADVKQGKRSRVPYNYKLVYVSGRCDAAASKPNRYESEK